MTVASGTSTPTSTTVVATSRRMRAGGEIGQRRRRAPPASCRPWARPTASPNRVRSSGEALLGGGEVEHLAFGDQRADPVDLRRRRPARGRCASHDVGHAWRASAAWCGSAAGRRGFSVRRLTSISPHWVSSRVRGIGVAVITSTSVRVALVAEAAGAASTPKRCCSSITARPRSRNATASWNSAWVPTTMRHARHPPARAARRARAAPLTEPVSSATGTGDSARQGAVVLLGQHLGRRHQRGLRAGLDGAQHGQQRHQRLAGADIALQQAQHAARRGQVGVDLGQGLVLATAWAEAEAAQRLGSRRCRRRSARGRAAPACPRGSGRARAGSASSSS